MTKHVKILALFLVLLLAVGTVAGCGKKQDDAKTPVPPAPGQEKTVLVMGTNAEFAPFEFINDANKVDGFDVDLAKEIADILGFELKIEDMDFEGLVPAVQSGRVDMVVAAMSIMPERLEKVNFTKPYFNASQVVVVREDNTDIFGVDDLAEGKVIAVQLGTTGDYEAQDVTGMENIVQFKQISLAFMELELGRADAIIVDEPVAKRYLSMKKGFKIVGDRITEEEYGIAVNKDDTELLNKINDALEQLEKNGKFEELMNKWFN